MKNEDIEDQVIRAQGGPVWFIIVNGEITGIEVSGTGGFPCMNQHERAAERLVRQGLLSRGNPRPVPNTAYSFTKRGEIAFWAIGEAQQLEVERKFGRAA